MVKKGLLPVLKKSFLQSSVARYMVKENTNLIYRQTVSVGQNQETETFSYEIRLVKNLNCTQ